MLPRVVVEYLSETARLATSDFLRAHPNPRDMFRLDLDVSPTGLRVVVSVESKDVSASREIGADSLMRLGCTAFRRAFDRIIAALFAEVDVFAIPVGAGV